MKLSFLPFLFLFAAGLCLAEDFVLVDGTVLQNAKVVRKDADSLVISHSAGVQRVSYDRLTPELQQRFDLTPHAVREYYDKMEQMRRDLAEAEDKKAAAQRAALQVSGLSPRYLTGADVSALMSTWETLSAVCAEYLAADWNRREAARCNLTVEANRFDEEAKRLVARMENERDAAKKEKTRVASLEAKLHATENDLKGAREQISSLRQVINRLNESSSQSSGTVIISRPTYVPIYRPAPIVVPPVVRPLPPPRPPVNRPPQLRPSPSPIRR